ncbi:MAG: PorT family protein [Bacteroidales bacterium]|nr:PorT family protein [Bacteroidales bacterium]
MKRFICILALALITLGGFAQTQKTAQQKTQAATKTAQQKKEEKKKEEEKEKMRVGVTGGLGFHTYKDKKIAVQAKIGADAQIPVLFEGLYALAGARLAHRTCGNYYTGRITNLYVEIPLKIGYTFELSDDLGIFAEVGPHLAMTLIKLKHEYDHTGHYNPFDIGLGLDGGVELFDKFRVSLGFDFGFIPPCSQDHACNGGIWLTAKYLF